MTACKWDNVIDFGTMWRCIRGLRKDKTPIVLFGSEPFSSMLRCSNIKEFKYDWVWDKKAAANFLNAKKQPLKIHEVISVFGEGTTVYIPLKTKGAMRKKGSNKIYETNVFGAHETKVSINDEYYPKSILGFSNGARSGVGKKVHPTQKPVALLEYLIKTYTNEGDTVLDFTMGSGSTAIACMNTNRKFIGIEIDDKYFNIAQERVRKHIEELTLKP